ncbi:MAG: hypothetical protein JSS69_17200 [Acidobacteria bacterium]|nr:hypothetical protein [Acidobacteriota bacterium]MBS1867654.1 hypothetical protein [Acidobacteriota bacterium]
MNESTIKSVSGSLDKFTRWLDGFGETSHDHQSYFASDLGRKAKALYYQKPLLGTLAVSPMIFSEALLPSARALFFKPLRFPIADAHYAMGFAFLAEAEKSEAHLKRAAHFLDVLKETRCKKFRNYAWGYPFNWETRRGTLWEGTPMITTLPYVYEAFRQVYQLNGDQQLLDVMRSIAQHALEDYDDYEVSTDASTCCYSPGPDNSSGVINANAYRSFLLMLAARDFSDERYEKVGQRNLNFVIQSQNLNGSWYYSTDNVRDFVDHFHTCFVLKALAKIERLTDSAAVRTVIDRGVNYYVANLFDSDGLPKPFSKPPRLTVYRNELYDYAECINLGTLLMGKYPELDRLTEITVLDVLKRWQKSGGSFRARKLLIGWDNVPMHRWAQSQLFRSLSFLLAKTTDSAKQLEGLAVASSEIAK